MSKSNHADRGENSKTSAKPSFVNTENIKKEDVELFKKLKKLQGFTFRNLKLLESAKTRAEENMRCMSGYVPPVKHYDVQTIVVSGKDREDFLPNNRVIIVCDSSDNVIPATPLEYLLPAQIQEYIVFAKNQLKEISMSMLKVFTKYKHDTKNVDTGKEA